MVISVSHSFSLSLSYFINIFLHIPSVLTDHGKVRALVRAALNERALERYILIWLSDVNGLEIKFEPWAFMRDNEATNLLPSIAAGLGSILFAITVDSRELNTLTVAEYKNRSSEIIIAVPAVTKERKSTGNKRTQIISFEDNDPIEPNRNIVSPPIPVHTNKSLSNACLKYVEPSSSARPIRNFANMQSIAIPHKSIASSSDSILDPHLAATLAQYDIVHSSSPRETDYLEPESPSSIKMYGSLPSYSADSMQDGGESSISKAMDTYSTTSHANTPNSSRQPSRQNSTYSSISSGHHNNQSSTTSYDITASGVHIDGDVNSESPPAAPSIDPAKFKQLEERCVSLERQVADLQL